MPHHGSLTAHNPDVLCEMLESEPIAVLTPWRRGRGRLSKADGVKAITAVTKKALATSEEGGARPKRRYAFGD